MVCNEQDSSEVCYYGKMKCYHIPNSADRRKVMSYVSSQLPLFFACSVRCSCFPSTDVTCVKCDHDNTQFKDSHVSLAPVTWHDDLIHVGVGGVVMTCPREPTGMCPTCDSSVYVETYYDSNAFTIHRNNVVVIIPHSMARNWHYKERITDSVTTEEYNAILDSSQHWIAPPHIGNLATRILIDRWLDSYPSSSVFAHH